MPDFSDFCPRCTWRGCGAGTRVEASIISRPEQERFKNEGIGAVDGAVGRVTRRDSGHARPSYLFVKFDALPGREVLVRPRDLLNLEECAPRRY